MAKWTRNPFYIIDLISALSSQVRSLNLTHTRFGLFSTEKFHFYFLLEENEISFDHRLY